MCFYGFLPHCAPLPMYACLSIPRRMLNRVPLLLLGSPLVILPNLNVFVLLHPLYVHLYLSFFLFLPHSTAPCRRCSESSCGLPSFCRAPVVIIIVCTTPVPPSYNLFLSLSTQPLGDYPQDSIYRKMALVVELRALSAIQQSGWPVSVPFTEIPQTCIYACVSKEQLHG